MKLLEALKIINAPAEASQPTRHVVLATGFTPLALETFLHAHLRERMRPQNVRVSSGRFGDLPGNLERAAAERPDGVAVVIEWADVDPRLGLRGHGVLPNEADELVGTAAAMLQRIAQRIATLAEHAPVAVCLPTLPLPPYFLDLPNVAGRVRLRLDAALATFAADIAATPRVRVVDAVRLARRSPVDARWDAAAELTNGFPYRREHAAHVAAALAEALRPAAPKKGLITDLDDTLWRGILGEVGVAGVRWGQEHHAHVHSLYQRALTNLLESGVLVGVASKNEAALVTEALGRDDLVVAAQRLFPVHASWGPKSAAVKAILETWNVGADSVVFVDDSPLELAEVQGAFPEVECLRFEPESPESVVALLQRLADLFGREEIREEDRLRADSIRQSAAVREAAQSGGDAEAFLSSLGAQVELVFSRDRADRRAHELVNKTNQFNLNGRRYDDTEWAQALDRPGAFLLTIAYRDKFGPLGKIGVAMGVAQGSEVQLDAWVLSCRAFARRIEHATLQAIFDTLGVDAVTLDVVHTPRNAPTQELLAELAGPPAPAGQVRITREAFAAVRPTLYHQTAVQFAEGAPVAPPAALTASSPA
ncbi:MAG: HAD-IIIC family phosphatase [Gemmatirosa sp.]|nr:HAD-IIIC family phosphatase [Gemmatirosa sp.]